MVPITHGNSSCDSIFESTLMMKWGGVCCVSKMVGFDAHNLLCMEASDPWRSWYLTNIDCGIFFLAQNRNGVQKSVHVSLSNCRPIHHVNLSFCVELLFTQRSGPPNLFIPHQICGTVHHITWSLRLELCISRMEWCT
jgi:hypothetical protein